MRTPRILLSAIGVLALSASLLSPAAAAPIAMKKGDLRFAKNAKSLTTAMKAEVDGWVESFGEMDTITITSYVPQGARSKIDLKLGTSRNSAVKNYLESAEVTSEFRVAVVRVKKKSPLANLTRVMHTDRPDLATHTVSFEVNLQGVQNCSDYSGSAKVGNNTNFQVTSHYVTFQTSAEGCQGTVQLVDIPQGTYQVLFDIWIMEGELPIWLATEGWYAGAGGPGMVGYGTEDLVELTEDKAYVLDFGYLT